MRARLIPYFRGLARRRRVRQEVDEELRFHIEQETAAHVERGIAPVEARRLALRDLGLARTREAVWDVRTIWVDRLSRDLRHAVRALLRTPTFTAVALVTLTLSIGASTAIYSVVDAVVLRGLPFDESDHLVAVTEARIDGSPDWRAGTWRGGAAPQNFFDWQEQQNVFDGLAAMLFGQITLRRDGDALPETVFVPAVTVNFFDVLRSPPLLGRTFTSDDERESSARVAVISYGFWQRRFGGRPDIIGAELGGSRLPFEIVGVMPPGFVYPIDAIEPVSAWVPYIPSSGDRVRGNDFGYNLHVIGRLRDGVSTEQAQARMDQITAGLAAETPRWFTDRVAKVEPLHQFLTGGVRTWMVMLLVAVSCVVLIACVNLAHLMLVRGTARTQEISIRAALGASRWDLARVLLLESLLLSVIGAAFGVLVAWWGVDVLRAVVPPDVPSLTRVAVNLRVLAATAFVAIVTGIGFGLAPALQFSRPAPGKGLLRNERVTMAGARTQRFRSVLVVTEVALATVLLVGSGLFLASFARVVNVDLGFDYRDVLTVRVRVLEVPEDAQQFVRRNRRLLLNVLDRVRRIPGVESAALLGQGLPLRGDLQTVDLTIQGRVLPRNEEIAFNQISPDYFRTMKIPLREGRFFTDADTENSEPVVILNEAAAARYFPAEDAVGHLAGIRGDRRVVGVVGNVRHDGPESVWRTQAFVPVTQNAVAGATLVVRTAPEQRGLMPAVRDAVWSEFPDARIPTQIDIHSLSEYFDGLVVQRRFNMLLLTLFGALGLLIAAAGIYGVLSYIVTRRTHEIGVRMALGALPSSMLVSILGRALMYVGVGLGLGVTGAWILAKLVEGFLFGIDPHDPTVYVGVLSTLVVTGIVAAFLPARRAARIDPLVAIRSE